MAALTPLPWLFIELTGGGRRLLTSHPGIISILAGLAIVGEAFLLGWGAELAERDITRPRSFAS